jgi:DedD protein
MEDGLKQRLVGAIILLALAVIFIPVVFDRERIELVDTRTQIPAAPHIEAVVIDVAVAPVVESEAPDAVDMFTPDENEAQNLEPESLSFDSQGVPTSWVIQIASFRIDGHAKQLRDKLAADGYSAYIKDVATERGKMTRLFVGPKLDKNILLQQKKEIEEKYKLTTILLNL